MFKLFFVIMFILNFSLQAYSVQKITLGVEAINYFPLHGVYDSDDKNTGQFNGMAADIFKLYNVSQNEYEIIFKPLPIKRLEQDFLNGNIDAKYPDNKFWSQDLKKGKDIKYSEPIINFTDGIFVLDKNKSATISDIKSLGTMAGFTPFSYLKEISSGKIKVEESNDTILLVEKLNQKKVDYIYVNKFIAECKLFKLKYKNIVYSVTLPHLDSEYYLSSIKYPDFVKSFNVFIGKYSKQIDKIKTNYLDKCK